VRRDEIADRTYVILDVEHLNFLSSVSNSELRSEKEILDSFSETNEKIFFYLETIVDYLLNVSLQRLLEFIPQKNHILGHLVNGGKGVLLWLN